MPHVNRETEIRQVTMATRLNQLAKQVSRQCLYRAKEGDWSVGKNRRNL